MTKLMRVERMGQNIWACNKNKKLKDVEISFPIVYGTISFWLGKKASEYNSHKWTVYIRSATNEDLSVIVKRVVFQLHPSFTNPTRVVEQPPFELSESGWGEFEIAITLYFHSDVCEKRLDLFHQLKLYPEEDAGPQSTKKPVVVETYDEVVFPEPTEAFFLRVQNHPAATVPRLPPGMTLSSPGPMELMSHDKKRFDTKDHSLSQWFSNFSEADELLKLAAARQQVQAHIAKLRRQLSMIEGMPQQSRVISVTTFVNRSLKGLKGFELMTSFTMFYVQVLVNSLGTANGMVAAVRKMPKPDNNSLTECDECIFIDVLSSQLMFSAGQCA
uniref:Protein AF-9-like protein n=1 Tax=Aegilops tauschii TaxID=37682 RepID=M8AQ73_AEGTA